MVEKHVQMVEQEEGEETRPASVPIQGALLAHERDAGWLSFLTMWYARHPPLGDARPLDVRATLTARARARALVRRAGGPTR
jgi:hypothetical protein